MQTDSLKRFVDLKRRKRELAAEMAKLTAEIDAIEPMLVEGFIQDGVSEVTQDGMSVYLHRQQWARAKDMQTGVAACARWGYGDVITLNTSKLSALFRSESELPEEFRQHFEVTERVGLNARERS